MRALFLAPLLALVLASACSRWHVAPVPPPRADGDSLALGTARLTTWSGPGGPVGFRGRTVLRDAQVRGDSLVGWDGSVRGEPRRVAVPLGQVSGLESRGVDWLRTGAVVVLTLVAAWGAAAVYLVSMGDV